MYQVTLRRKAYKDLKSIPADYVRLIAQHIDSLEDDPRPNDSKKLKGYAGYSLRVGAYRVLHDIYDKSQRVRKSISSLSPTYQVVSLPTPLPL